METPIFELTDTELEELPENLRDKVTYLLALRDSVIDFISIEDEKINMSELVIRCGNSYNTMKELIENGCPL